jgi:hypothetical protein
MDNVINLEQWLKEHDYTLSDNYRHHVYGMGFRRHAKLKELVLEETIKLDEPIVLPKPKKRKKVS